MKIIAIGDTHGRDKWKQIVAKEVDKDTTFVFIGDYFDSWGLKFETQMENFKEILDFKRGYADKVVLLIGNHDFHYLSDIGESYSGFQQKHALEINAVVQAAIDEGLLQMAYQHDHWLFTHAGVTSTWIQKHIDGDYESMSDFINQLFLKKRTAFCFDGVDNTGDNITQSPIWVRPKSLADDRIALHNQVVGHTTMDEIEHVHSIEGDDSVDLYFIDTIGTSKEYLVIEEGVVVTKKYE